MVDGAFWQSALLYIYRPNLINRRVIGAKLLRYWICPADHKLEDIVTILNQQPITLGHLDEIFEATNSFRPDTALDELVLMNQHHQHQCVLALRKLFRKQSLKSLTAESSYNKQQQPTTTIIDNNSNSNSEYEWLILAPMLNTFAILPVILVNNKNNGDNVIVDGESDDENSGHVHINIRKNDIAFTISLMIDETQQKQSLKLGFLLLEQLHQQQQQDQKTTHRTHYWLENVFKPKFEKWLKSSTYNNGKYSDNTSTSTSSSFEGSIRNVSVESYCQNYNRLKEKYVSSLMNIWSNVEKTDPIKFIYEDIAICAYLITLWQEEMEKFSLKEKQTFIDIGCGNGLLVYILTQEGYCGYGVDVRKRNIWQHYPNNTRLIQMTIDLFNCDDDFKLDACDWMIGNHSDELTPWIIYMAAQASSNTRAFLLPCCCFDFDGFKFQRTTQPNKSQYQCYIDFLQRLCHQFGFKCFRDKLRIPSTKRICLVCYDRTYLDNGNSLAQQQQLNPNLTDGQQQQYDNKNTSRVLSIENEWKDRRRQIVQQSLQSRPEHRRLKESEETVRNCTRIDQNIKQEIINRLTKRLLDTASSQDSSLTFQEAIQLLESMPGQQQQKQHQQYDSQSNNDLREHLKNQCGGLQTFIRNHKHIFTIENNRIRFQRKEFLEQQPQNGTIRTKECWFYRNHPEGCPVDGTKYNTLKQQQQNYETIKQCSYKH